MVSNSQRPPCDSSDTASIRSIQSFGRRFFERCFSNASALSVGTINTVLPGYSEVDTSVQGTLPSLVPSDMSSAPTTSNWNQASNSSTGSLEHAPRYSLIKSTVLEWTPDSAVTNSQGNITPHPEPHEFHYLYPIKSNDTWARLHLYTQDKVPGNPNPSLIQPKVPRIWGCNPVAGMVELDLTSLQTIHQIKISVKGKVMTSLNEVSQFVHNEFTIWQKSFGNPQYLNTTESLSNGKFDGRLIGKYSFPFSFPFPTFVNIQNKSAIRPDATSFSPFSAPAPLSSTPSPSAPSRPSEHEKRWNPGSSSGASNTLARCAETFSHEKRPLGAAQIGDRSQIISVASHIPQTFSERDVPVTIVYEISTIITHGRFKSDSKIKTNISYMPAMHPLPVSEMRRHAYESNCHVPGPMKDPTGWFMLPTARSFGMFSDDLGQRHVAVDCTLYLAEPLSYTRGTVIPCFLELSSDDMEALKRLSRPNVPVVKLLRRLRYPGRDDQYEAAHIPGSFNSGLLADITPLSVMSSDLQGKVSLDFAVTAHEVGMARWKVFFDDGSRKSSVHRLEGEIHLSDDLQPSCSCKVFRVEYFVEMLALHSREFKAIVPKNYHINGRPKKRVLTFLPVEITTLGRPDEPIPVTFTESPRPYSKRIHAEHPILEVKEAGVDY